MILLAEVVPDFVKILGYGLSGFAFLLMFFAYMLLRQVITKQTQNRMIFTSIWGFMGLSFLLTIAIGVFSYMTGDYKKEKLAENEETIEKQQTGLQVLTESQTIDSLAHNVSDNVNIDTAKVNEAKRKFEFNIAQLQMNLEKADATPEDKRRVNLLKEESTKTLDSLKRPDLSYDTRERLNSKLNTQANEISKISTNVVRRNMRVTAATNTRARP